MLLLAGLATAQAQESNPAASHQSRFEAGLVYLQQENYTAATEVFKALYQDTRSERVRLEWARAAYLARDYAQAERLFRAVASTGPPLPVREKINAFLEDIALARGTLDYTVSMNRDTNPRALPSVRTFTLFGLPFEYQPAVDTSPKWGMNYKLTGSKGLDDYRQWIGSFGVLGTHFADPQINRAGFDAHLTYRLRIEPSIQLKGSYEHLDMGPDPFYRYTWITASYANETFKPTRWRHELKYGAIEYPRFAFQNSVLTSYQFLISKPLARWVAVGLEWGWNDSRAVESPYSYVGTNQGVSVSGYLPAAGTRLQLKYMTSNRDHGVEDPFFGIKRLDTRDVATLSVEPGLRIGGLIPMIEVGIEKNNSTLALNRYERVIASLSFRRSF